LDIDQINWSAIWRDGIIFFAGRADKAASWDGAAARWNQTQIMDDYGKKVLKRLRINPDWTVLDVGCGAGLLAIPVAKKCRCVTALDVSSEMLKYLKQNAELQDVRNITCINKAFETVAVGEELEQHDVVVASRSMGWEHNLERFLRGMDDAAKRRAYVVWGAGERTFDVGMYKAIGRPYGETRTYIIIYNLLYQMGIRANIEIFECQATAMSYKSIDDGLSQFRNRFEKRSDNQELTREEEKRLEKYLRETLKKKREGTFRFVDKNPARHALIWWEKRGQTKDKENM
jgi:SAM-dependent methyltransferase